LAEQGHALVGFLGLDGANQVIKSLGKRIASSTNRLQASLLVDLTLPPQQHGHKVIHQFPVILRQR